MGKTPESIKLLILKWKNGQITDEERRQLERWYAELPPAEVNWYSTRDTSEQQLKQRLWRSIYQRMASHTSIIPLRRNWSRGTQIAASIILIAGLFYGLSIYRFVRQAGHITQVHVQQKNGVQRFILPDRSIVWLKGNSQLSYPATFTGTTREVSLTGEALFEVTPNQQKPFIVRCGDYQARVVGTSFNLKLDPLSRRFQLVVLTGTVQVSRKTLEKDEPVLITANQRFESTEALPLVGVAKQPLPIQQVQPLIQGTAYNMAFDKVPFALIIHRFEEKFNVKMVGYTGEYESCTLTADLTDQSLDKSLSIICKVLNANYEIDGNSFKIWGGGCF